MVLRNCSTSVVVASDVVVASSICARTIGLLARGAITPDEGMVFLNACAIHTVGMRASLDVLFLDGENRVVQIRPAVPPNRIVYVRGAAAVVELGAGALERTDVLVGDRLELES